MWGWRLSWGDEDVARTHKAEAVNARVVLKLLKD
jgi:hypothetical protein